MDRSDRHAGVERPVLLLFDSVSSHVDHDVFIKAKSKGIELCIILPNAIHLMQPLDKDVWDHLSLSGTLHKESTHKNLRNRRKTEVHLRFFRALFRLLSDSALPIN